MQKLFIKQTLSTPEICFSPDENVFSIRGISSPEDVRAMYYPVIDWIKIFVDDILAGTCTNFNQENPINLQIDLSYFNSSSAKFLFDLLKEMQRIILSDVPFNIVWLYDPEDPDMKGAGEDFSSLVGMKFILVAKPKTN